MEISKNGEYMVSSSEGSIFFWKLKSSYFDSSKVIGWGETTQSRIIEGGIGLEEGEGGLKMDEKSEGEKLKARKGRKGKKGKLDKIHEEEEDEEEGEGEVEGEETHLESEYDYLENLEIDEPDIFHKKRSQIRHSKIEILTRTKDTKMNHHLNKSKGVLNYYRSMERTRAPKLKV